LLIFGGLVKDLDFDLRFSGEARRPCFTLWSVLSHDSVTLANPHSPRHRPADERMRVRVAIVSTPREMVSSVST
jgi:hypothetical protein